MNSSLFDNLILYTEYLYSDVIYLNNILINQFYLMNVFSYIGNSTVNLHGIELMYDPKSPQFGVNHREEGGVLVEWASETSGLVKGDR